MAAADASFNVRDHGTSLADKNRVKCNHCGKVMSGFFCLKYHLGGIRGDVTPCEMLPQNLKEFFRNILLETKRGILIREVGDPNRPLKTSVCSDSNGSKRIKCEEASENANCGCGGHESTLPSRRRIGSSMVMGSNSDKGKSSLTSLARPTQKAIGRFFYEMGIDFNVVDSPSFKALINATLGDSQGKYEIPGSDQLKGLMLQEEVKEIQEHVERIKHSWETTGCSILLDGWIDKNGQNLVNFIVDCPQGPIYLRSCDVTIAIADVDSLQLLLDGIIQEVGLPNIVQIIASSTTGWMGDLGKQFMERQSKMFWSVSASHCIELLLEKITMMDSVREILDEAKTITSFIYDHATVLNLFRDYSGGCELIKTYKVSSAMYLMTLENIILEKENLNAMFGSSAWNTSNWGSTTKGNRVVNLIKDGSFWSRAMTVVKKAIPVVNVLLLIDRAEKPQVGYIYEIMDQLKETIRSEFNGKESMYDEIWNVVDEIWNTHLHSPLHGAAYYLNPSLRHASDFNCDEEVSSNLLSCITMVQDQNTQASITRQLDKYANGKGEFSEGRNMEERNKYHPVEWWSRYGNQCPELQKFAIRILSQTCDGASKYGLKKSLSEKLLTNNKVMKQQHLSDLAFVYYNLQLQNSRQTRLGDIED